MKRRTLCRDILWFHMDNDPERINQHIYGSPKLRLLQEIDTQKQMHQTQRKSEKVTKPTNNINKSGGIQFWKRPVRRLRIVKSVSFR